MLPRECEQFYARRRARTYAGGNDVRAREKGLADMTESRFRLTGIGAARFSHYVILGLSEPLGSGLEPARAWILSQRAPVGGPLEQRWNIESSITADEAITTVCYGGEDDGDPILESQVLRATLNRGRQPATYRTEPDDREEAA